MHLQGDSTQATRCCPLTTGLPTNVDARFGCRCCSRPAGGQLVRCGSQRRQPACRAARLRRSQRRQLAPARGAVCLDSQPLLQAGAMEDVVAGGDGTLRFALYIHLAQADGALELAATPAALAALAAAVGAAAQRRRRHRPGVVVPAGEELREGTYGSQFQESLLEWGGKSSAGPGWRHVGASKGRACNPLARHPPLRPPQTNTVIR